MALTLDVAPLWPILAFVVSYAFKGWLRTAIQCVAVVAFAVYADLPAVARVLYAALGLGLAIYEGNNK